MGCLEIEDVVEAPTYCDAHRHLKENLETKKNTEMTALGSESQATDNVFKAKKLKEQGED